MDKKALIAQGFTEEQADTIIKAHNDAIANNFVPLSVHNEVREDLKAQKALVAERDTQIAELGKDVGSVEDLQAKVKKLEEDNAIAAKEYADNLALERRSNNLKATFSHEVHDVDYVLSLLDMDKIMFNEDNTIASGFKEQYESIKKDKPFAFKEVEPNEPNFTPKGALNGQGKTTQTPKDTFKGEAFVKGLAKARNEASKSDANYFGENNK